MSEDFKTTCGLVVTGDVSSFPFRVS